MELSKRNFSLEWKTRRPHGSDSKRDTSVADIRYDVRHCTRNQLSLHLPDTAQKAAGGHADGCWVIYGQWLDPSTEDKIGLEVS